MLNILKHKAGDEVEITDLASAFLKFLELERLKSGRTFSVWLRASFYESDGVLDELPAGLYKLHNLIHLDVRLERNRTRSEHFKSQM